MNQLIDIAGQKFGRVTAVRHDGFFNKSRMALWLCLCDCGTLFEVAGANLRRGLTHSCGCLRRDLLTIHGHTVNRQKSPTRMSWNSMRQRCENPSHVGYRHYGAKGVRVCEAWHDFAAFLRDMGERPAGCVLSRKGDAGNYEPGNVEWKLRAENRREQRKRRAT